MIETFGERLKRLRKRQHMSQIVFGQHVGVTNQTISNWEMQWNRPSMLHMERMAKALGVTLYYLTNGYEEPVHAAIRSGMRRKQLLAMLGDAP